MIGHRPSILITDDDRGFREALRGVLDPHFGTHVAADGEEALRIVRTQTVHLVLLDMHMPKLTGLETLRIVKQHFATLPCILMSAEADERLRREAAAARAFAVLTKPVSGRRVTHAVARALQTTYRWPLEQRLASRLGLAPSGDHEAGDEGDEIGRIA